MTSYFFFFTQSEEGMKIQDLMLVFFSLQSRQLGSDTTYFNP